jgi:hypothetical protein
MGVKRDPKVISLQSIHTLWITSAPRINTQALQEPRPLQR